MTEDDQLDLRQTLGRFATGVTVVTCLGDKGPCGITANSFSSVSLDPPLILWNIAKVSNSLRAYLAAGHFAINVLGADQRELSHHFAQSDHTVFKGVEYSVSEHGVPLLPDTIASFECRTRETHDCGDHFIIIGEVERFDSNDGDPLLFFGGDYRLCGNKL
ncbi:MAG: flavin reductase family protein [Woeseiaceae bacterium]|nr:flavin reductase family protein [Woeseiaceae bacterium]